MCPRNTHDHEGGQVKTNIPWKNYIMRKYGRSIRDKISETFTPAWEAIIEADKLTKERDREIAPMNGAWLSNKIGKV